MRKSLGLSAVIAGFFGYLKLHFYLNPNIIFPVVLPMCALLSLCLGTVTWKQKGEVFSYATLLASAGIAGAVLGMTFMVIMD